jgi:hypothetical protein
MAKEEEGGEAIMGFFSVALGGNRKTMTLVASSHGKGKLTLQTTKAKRGVEGWTEQPMVVWVFVSL